ETEVKSTWDGRRAGYEELLKAGVKIYEYRTTELHATTHIGDDRWCAVGSMNADNRSLSFNEETVLMMLDDAMTSTVERHFLDDLAYADQIQLDEFMRRGVVERVKEFAAHAFWRIL